MMKSNKALARKILCGLLAAGVLGVSGSALAAESKPNEAIAGEDKNVNATYSDGKISGVYCGLTARGDASSSKEAKISLTTANIEINATGVGIQGTNWGKVIVGNTDTQDISITGTSQGVKLSKGSNAEITGNQVKISNESKKALIEIDNGYKNMSRSAQLIVKGKQIELESAGMIIDAKSRYESAKRVPVASVILGDDSTELLDMKGTNKISAGNNTEIIGTAKDIKIAVNSTASTTGVYAGNDEAKVSLTAKDKLLLDVTSSSGAKAIDANGNKIGERHLLTDVKLEGNDVKIRANGNDGVVYGIKSSTYANVTISGNTAEISTIGGKNKGEIGSSALYANNANIKVDANKVVVNTTKASEHAFAVYSNWSSNIELGKDANSEVQISSSSEGKALGVAVASAEKSKGLEIEDNTSSTPITPAIEAPEGKVNINGAKINVSAEGKIARGLYAQDKNKISVGDTGSDINISAKGTDDAIGIDALIHGFIDLNGQNATIKAESDKTSVGIHVQNNDMNDETNRATVNVNTKNTTINADTALSAMSHSVLNVNSNLVTNGKNAILTRGNSDVNINTNGKHTTQLNGDIVFNYDEASSGTGIDSNVNVNLNGEGSYWTGNTKAQWNSDSGKPDSEKMAVSHMTLNVENGAQWNPTYIKDDGSTTDNSGVQGIALNNLKLANGTVNLDSSKLNEDAPVKVENLSGNGTIVTDSLDNKLSISNKAAESELTVNGTKEVTDAIASGKAKLQDLANVVKGKDDKSAADTVTSDANDIIGGYSAKLDGEGKVQDNTVKTIENTTNRAISDMANISLMTWRAENNDMNKRLGELRDSKGEHGAWARMARGESKYGAQNVKNQYNYYQVGYDEKLSVDPNWTVGVALTRTEGNSTFAAGSGENKHTGVAVYGSYLNDNGSFIDLIAKYARMDNEYKTIGAGVGDADYKANGYSLSAEYGKRFTKDNGFWIEPQVELTYGTVGSVDYLTSKGYNVHQDSVDSLVARLGFSLGKNIKQGNVYVRASYLYDFDGETKATMSGAGTASFEQDLGGGWWEVGVGTNLNLSEATHLYFDVEKTYGGNVATPWQWNAGVRWSF